MAKEVKQSRRNVLIEKLMSDKYGDDDPKYDDSNLAFLESLSLKELEELDTKMFDPNEVSDEYEEI